MFFGGSLEAIVDRSVRISNSGVDGQAALVVRNRGIGAGIEEHSDAFSVRACRGYGERGNADVVTAVDGAALVLECDAQDGDWGVAIREHRASGG